MKHKPGSLEESAQRVLLGENSDNPRNILESSPEESDYMMPSGGAFYRLPREIIGNELFSLSREMNTFYRSQANGNDFDMGVFDAFIREMQKIKNAVKQFKPKDEVPPSYQGGLEESAQRVLSERLNYQHEAITAIAEALEDTDPEAIERVRSQIREWLNNDNEEGRALNYLIDTVESKIEELLDYQTEE